MLKNCLLIALGCLLTSSAVGADVAQKPIIESRMLPMAVISYAFGAGYGESQKELENGVRVDFDHRPKAKGDKRQLNLL